MLIKAQNPDIVISFLARVNIAAALATIGLKPPLIICERTWPPFTSLSNNLNWIYKIIFRRVNQIIVQTNESKSWLRKKLHFYQGRSHPKSSGLSFTQRSVWGNKSNLHSFSRKKNYSCVR